MTDNHDDSDDYDDGEYGGDCGHVTYSLTEQKSTKENCS
jgi:hypothetical protein